MAKGIFSSLKGVDAFGKTMEDVKVKTRTGAFLTLLSAAFILTFMTVEFIDYRRVDIDTSLIVDKSMGEKVTVNMNVTFPRVPCFLLSMDVMDISGDIQRDISHNVIKTRLDSNGEYIPNSHSVELESDFARMNKPQADGFCGSCYGATPPEGGCCNSCDAVREAYTQMGWSFGSPDDIEQCKTEHWKDKLIEQAAEGCNIAGRVRVNKVIGNIHFSPGRSFQAGGRKLYDLVPYLEQDGRRHDFTHHIHYFRFEGDDEYNPDNQQFIANMRDKLAIDRNPLDGQIGYTIKTHYMYQYFLKVVSTRFVDLNGRAIGTHQYSSTHFERDLDKGADETNAGVHVSHLSAGLPGAYFNFEISPILVVHSETRQSFAHFLTSTCAIVGGVLTVASLVDSLLFATQRALKKSSSGQYSSSSKLM